MQLNPQHQKIITLLSGRLFAIPEYQRAYSWLSKQRNDLFEDIIKANKSSRDHFMATIVTLVNGTHSIGADEFRSVSIVDGQQRITTIIILFKSIEKALNSDIDGQEKLKREILEMLVKGDEHSLLLLQTNHSGSNVFANYIRNGEIFDGVAVNAADKQLILACKECEMFVEKWVKDKTLTELVGTLRNRFSVIYHEITDEATVYRVFEVLNSRGLAVKWIDKLKSQLMALIFEHVEEGTRKQAIIEMQGIWQQIYHTLGIRGELGDEALCFTGMLVQTSKLKKIMSEENAVDALVLKADKKIKSIMEVARLLKRTVEVVYDLNTNPRLTAVRKIRHSRFLYTTIVLRNFSKKDQADLLNKWENVTFRIFGLGGADSRNKVGEYVGLGNEISQGEITFTDINSKLRKLGGDYKIDEILKWPKLWNDCYPDWSEELRYLLIRYEEYLSKKAGEKISQVFWNKIWSAEPSRSIEHVCPQSSKKRYIHQMGNLTLLPPGLNSSLGKKKPKDKREAYEACGLRGASAIGKTIENKGKWTQEDVDDREKLISDFVRKEWAD